MDVLRTWPQLRSHLPANYQHLAIEHKQLELQYGNAKITTAEELLQLILVHVGGDYALRQTVSLVQAAGGPAVSAMRLHMKMRRAAPYLEALIAQLAQAQSCQLLDLQRREGLVTLHSTPIQSAPSDKPSSYIHSVLSLPEHAYLAVEVTQRTPDTSLQHFGWQRGQLVVAGPEHCSVQGFTWLRQCAAHGLLACSAHQISLLTASGQSFDHQSWLQSLQPDRVQEQSVWLIDPTEQQSPVRLRLIACSTAIASPLAPRAKRLGVVTRLAQGQPLVLLTAAPRTWLSAPQALELYRYCAQLEQLYRRCQMLSGLEHLPNSRSDTIHAWLCAKTLLGLLLDRMQLSPPHLASVSDSPTAPPESGRTRRGSVSSEPQEPSLAAVRNL